MGQTVTSPEGSSRSTCSTSTAAGSGTPTTTSTSIFPPRSRTSWRQPKDLGPTLRRALDSRVPSVVDVDVELEQKGYRSVSYPYPANFHETWQPGPAAPRSAP